MPLMVRGACPCAQAAVITNARKQPRKHLFLWNIYIFLTIKMVPCQGHDPGKGSRPRRIQEGASRLSQQVRSPGFSPLSRAVRARIPATRHAATWATRTRVVPPAVRGGHRTIPTGNQNSFFAAIRTGSGGNNRSHLLLTEKAGGQKRFRHLPDRSHVFAVIFPRRRA